MNYYYQDSHCTLWLGDNREVLEAVDTSGVDLLLTDPPYGIGWGTDYTKLHCNKPGKQRLKKYDFNANTWKPIENDAQPFDPTPWLGYPQVILWGGHHYRSRLPQSGRWLVWDKRHQSGKSVLAHGDMAWMKGGAGSVWIFSHTWVGVSRQGEENRAPALHPTQKPVALMRWCMTHAGSTRKAPRPGIDTILDPYAGSGTTLVAARQLGKCAIGIEIEEQYAETAAKRLERTDTLTQLPLHLSDPQPQALFPHAKEGDERGIPIGTTQSPLPV